MLLQLMANFAKAGAGLDFTLFMRPFTHRSWISLLIITLASCSIILCYKLPSMEKYQKQDSFRIVMFMIWTFFLLLNAFYGGALIMFFTTKSAPPFTSVREGLSHDEWKMIMVDGTQILVQPLAEGNNPDPLFKSWWLAAHESDIAKGEHFLPSHKEAIFQLLDSRHFLYGNENAVAAELPIPGLELDLQVMGRSKRQTNTGVILLPRASPLKKFFDKGN